MMKDALLSTMADVVASDGITIRSVAPFIRAIDVLVLRFFFIIININVSVAHWKHPATDISTIRITAKIA